MGRYIEQLRILKTRGEGTAKPTQPPAKTEGVMTVLAPGYPLVSKNLEFCQRIQSATTTAEYFAVMRDFRATNPSDDEIAEVYRIAGLKLATLKGGGAHLLEEIDRRTMEVSGRSPEAVQPLPLSLHQARAIIHKYGPSEEVWDRFWLWVGKQIESGADADWVEASERTMLLACNVQEKER